MKTRNLIWLLFGPAYQELKLLVWERINRKKIFAAEIKFLLDKYERPAYPPNK